MFRDKRLQAEKKNLNTTYVFGRKHVEWNIDKNLKTQLGPGFHVGVTIPHSITLHSIRLRATRNGDVNNHIAEHHLKTKHQIDWDSATCITYSTDYYQRLTLESWFTNLEQTPLDRSQQLPAPYKRLINEITDKKKSKLLAIEKGNHLAFPFPISTIACKISPRIKGYESKYPSRMNSCLKFVKFLTLDLT